MKAIILLGHGSRKPDAGKDMERTAMGLQKKYGHALVKVCNVSLAKPYFPETLAACAAQGADEVLVIPYFLHLGVHLDKDIPELLAAEAMKFPQIKVVMGSHLGFDEALVDLVEKRVRDSAANPPVSVRKTGRA